MTLNLAFTEPILLTFILVVCRLSGLFLLAPVFSSNMIPKQVKVMALIALAATITPIVQVHATVPDSIFVIVALAFKELLIGLGLGFAVAVVFSAVQVGASLIDTGMGFSMANLIDPLNNAQGSIFGSFYTMVGTLGFLAANGHEYLLAGFAKSYDIVSVTQVPDFTKMLTNCETIFVGLFSMGLQIAAPIIVTLLMVDIVLGVTSRVVPQMNVYFVGIPLKIGIGMGAVVIGMPTFINFMEGRVSDIVTGASVLAGTVHH